MSRVADRLEQSTAWSSVEIEVEVEHTIRPGSSDDSNAYTTERFKYMETAGGRRYLDQFSPMKSGKVTHFERYADGRRFATKTYEPAEPTKAIAVATSAGFGMEGQLPAKWTDHPTPLRYYHLAGKPLHEAVRGGKIDGRSTVAGRACLVIRIDGVEITPKPVVIRVALDEDTGIPLRMAQGDDPKKPDWVWETQETQVVDNHLVPWRSVYNWTPGGSSTPRVQLRTTVTSIAFDKTYPPSQFWPKAQPGMEIPWGDPTDFGAPAGPKAKAASARPHQPKALAAGDPQSPTPAPAIDASLDPNPNGWMTPFFAATGVGLLAVAGALLLARRNRS